jgi:hypothetical protein
MRTHEEEKLRALRKAVVKSATGPDEERRLEDRIMATANSFSHRDWCPLCDRYGYAFGPWHVIVAIC